MEVKVVQSASRKNKYCIVNPSAEACFDALLGILIIVRRLHCKVPATSTHLSGSSTVQQRGNRVKRILRTRKVTKPGTVPTLFEIFPLDANSSSYRVSRSLMVLSRFHTKTFGEGQRGCQWGKGSVIWQGEWLNYCWLAATKLVRILQFRIRELVRQCERSTMPPNPPDRCLGWETVGKAALGPRVDKRFWRLLLIEICAGWLSEATIRTCLSNRNVKWFASTKRELCVKLGRLMLRGNRCLRFQGRRVLRFSNFITGASTIAIFSAGTHAAHATPSDT